MPKEPKSKCCKKCVNGGKIGVPLQGCCNGCPCHSTPTTLEKILEEFDNRFPVSLVCKTTEKADWFDMRFDLKKFISSHFTALLEELEKDVESWQYQYDNCMTMMSSKKNYEKGSLARELASEVLQIIKELK